MWATSFTDQIQSHMRKLINIILLWTYQLTLFTSRRRWAKKLITILKRRDLLDSFMNWCEFIH